MINEEETCQEVKVKSKRSDYFLVQSIDPHHPTVISQTW
jgi:hypothetical protein